ncbi:MAG: SDR family oxidoreductase [Phycisphaerales bacterium]
MPETYLVTGANRGIGLEFAKQLSAQGHTVIGTTRSMADADDLKKVAAKVLELDHTDAESVARLKDSLEGTPVDVLINNGATGPRKADLPEVDCEGMVSEFDVNAVGPLRVIKAMLPNIKQSDRKVIVSVSSAMGSLARCEDWRSYGYCASKAALNMLMLGMSKELKPQGVTCCVLHPGHVQTRMGGDEAPVSPAESVEGMVGIIGGLDIAQTGMFYEYRGNMLPW